MLTNKIAFTVREAADATGLSQDSIKRAIRSGDLASYSPRIEGRKLTTVLIAADELARWALGKSA